MMIRVAFIENTGQLQASIPQFKEPRYFQQKADRVKFGALATPFGFDWDGDGDIDVLSASRDDDKIAWYENDGSESFTAHNITTDADGARSVYAVDVDGDGDMDVLSASMNDDKIAWYENTTIVGAPLVINEIVQNPGAVNDPYGEWFEIYNKHSDPINLNGWTFKDNGSNSFTISGDTSIIQPNDYFVLGVNGNTSTNGGIHVDFVYQSTSVFALWNASDAIIILNPNGDEIDRVEYDDGNTFPDPDGKSMELTFYALDNNFGQNWVESTHLLPSGDYGTPGAVNSSVKDGGFALSFDGVDDYVEVQNAASLNITEQISLAAWIKYPGGMNDEKTWAIIDKAAVALFGPVGGYTLHLKEGVGGVGKLRFSVYDDDGGFEINIEIFVLVDICDLYVVNRVIRKNGATYAFVKNARM